MTQKKDEETIDAIVGAALEGLLQRGVSGAHLGSFAASFRDSVSGILGHKKQEQEAPDLLELVTQAVKIAIADPSIAQVRERKKPRAQKINVEVRGQRTSITVPLELMAKLDDVTGTRKETHALLRQLAEKVPADVENRSAWVNQRASALTKGQAVPTARH